MVMNQTAWNLALKVGVDKLIFRMIGGAIKLSAVRGWSFLISCLLFYIGSMIRTL